MNRRYVSSVEGYTTTVNNWDSYVLALSREEYELVQKALSTLRGAAAMDVEMADTPGFTEQAQKTREKALELGEQLGHPTDVLPACQICFHRQADYYVEVEGGEEVERSFTFCDRCSGILQPAVIEEAIELS